jgi:peptide/nickel transport system substrate-binding protein
MRPTLSICPLVGLLTIGCLDRAGSDRTGGAPTGGTIVIAIPGTGSTPMIPPYANDLAARIVTDNVYERLAEIGPEMNTVGDQGFTPRLARSWQWAADSMSIAFSIDPRARFHDGRPVRAADVRFTVELLKDTAAPTLYTPILANVDSVAVRDSLTAVAWYKRRLPEQFYQIAHQVHVLPEHLLKDIPRKQLATSPAAQQPVGTGRFRMARFEPGVRVELVADTTHYRGRPKLDRAIISFVPDPSAMLAQLFGGQADFVEIVPPPAWPTLDSSSIVRGVPYPNLQYAFLGFNFRDPKRPAAQHPILSDKRVRLAIAMGVDREAMRQNVFGARGSVASGPFARALADTTVRVPGFDRAHASALLDSAGWIAGAAGIRRKGGRALELRMLVPTSSAPRMRYSVLLQEQLRALGVHSEIDAMEIQAFIERLNTGNYDMVLGGLNTDPSRATILQDWGTAFRPPSGRNSSSYSNRTFEALIDSAEKTFDPARAGTLYHRAYQTIVDDVPAVWLYDVVTLAGVHKRVRTEMRRPDGWFVDLADWWIPDNERIARDRIGLRAPQR